MSVSLSGRARQLPSAFVLFAVSACSSSSQTTIEPDAAPIVDAAPSDGGADAGLADSQVGPEASASCASPDGGSACNPLASAGTSVSVTCGAEPPQMLGGIISDGTYVLTAETRYHCPDGGLGDLPGTDAATITISGSCLEGITRESAQTITYAASLDEHGDALTMTAVCSSLIGGFSTTSATFTATPTTLSILLPYAFPELQVFTKQ